MSTRITETAPALFVSAALLLVIVAPGTALGRTEARVKNAEGLCRARCDQGLRTCRGTKDDCNVAHSNCSQLCTQPGGSAGGGEGQTPNE